MRIIYETQLMVHHGLPYRDLIRERRFEHCHAAVTEQNFPSSSREGIEQVDVALISFPICVRMFRVLREVERRGYERSTVRQLLTLALQARDVLSVSTITALMPFWDCPHTGLEFAARVCFERGQCSSVDIVPCESCWNPDDLFLVAVPAVKQDQNEPLLLR